MSNTLQEFIADATQKASHELAEAFLRLPEDKRNWSPDEKARTALDQMAECAILNGYAATLIQTREWSNSGFDKFFDVKAGVVAEGWERINTLLKENTEQVVAAIRAVPDSALNDEIALPWQKQTLAQTLNYPYWNMSYHLGQINYIASILGCLG